ncbi:MAG: tetraacyldisaccharide 4'-kinase [Candidatus Omnitrophica bacterium]|nr:tetraacyldisaccharide 4'-kinase [Candidatus Omnitrophota bacterium]
MYGGAVAWRNAAYDRGWATPARLPCPVISVGNLTVGGTGKTACVELMTRKLQHHGKRVAILSRGYGGRTKEYWLRVEHGELLVNDGELPADERLADEPQLLATHLPGTPVLVGARRAHMGRLACATFGCDALVLDDGFQHRQLARDCDVVLIAARTDLSGLDVFPRGPLREPLASLARAHVIIVTKANDAPAHADALMERLRAVNRDATLATAVHEPSTLREEMTRYSHAVTELRGKQVGLLSSIGDPEGFAATVQRLHATVLWHQRFPDHHRYREEDWRLIMARCAAARPDVIVTTEKDWVRLRPYVGSPSAAPVPVWVLGIHMTLISGERELDDRLARLCAR